ncbi:MAG: DUF4424 family protein [Treponema sp.]|nr:DUF4424 family protein [Treponema sp.]MBR5645211.1 DUF4424 family protein [Treponema sp.]
MKKLIILLLLFITSVNCFADDAHGRIEPYLGGFKIQDCDSIEMTDEVVEIWEDRVKVTFHFKNLSSQKQTVTIGFPVKWYEEIGVRGEPDEPLKDDAETRARIEDYYKFKSTCNGKPLKRKLISSANSYDGFNFWFTTELSFEPGQTLEVIDEYNSGYSYGSDSIGYSWNTWTYILTTGSSWVNSIQKATIIFHSKYEYKWKYNNVERYSGKDIKYIWNIDKMTYHQCYFSYKPSSIRYDKKSGETVVTWVLKDIKPTEEWEAEEQSSLIHSPSNWKQEFAWFLVKDELYKIPGYEEKGKWWLDERFTDDSGADSIYKDFSDKKEFYEWVKELYDTGFTEFQPKSKDAGVFAQLLINSIYAMHGYEFKNEKWTKIFSNFSWYKPVTSSISDKDLTAEEKDMIKRLIQYR